jgi:hypothetical protein
MATLFERIVNPPENPGANESKIAIHAARELLRELGRGNITGAEIATLLDLDASQQTDLIAINTQANLASNKMAFFDMLFGFLALGELNIKPAYYRDETTFWARVNGF